MLVAKRIMAQVESRRLGPGDKLPPEHAMLEEYAVGRSTLREALRFLELQVVLSLKTGPGGGPVLRQPSASHLATTLALGLQLRDAPYRVIIEARIALEPVMAGQAAASITEQELEQLRLSNVQMLHQPADLEVFLRANKHFHDVIALASRNALFASILEALLGIWDGTVMGIAYPPQSQAAIAEDHQEIYQRLCERDAPGATDAMRRHATEYLRYAERRYAHVLDRRVTWDMLSI